MEIQRHLSTPGMRHRWDVVKLIVVVMRGRGREPQCCLIFVPLWHQIVSLNLISLKMKHRVPAVPQASRGSET